MVNFESASVSSTQFIIPTKTTTTSSWSPWTHDIDLDVPDGYVISKEYILLSMQKIKDGEDPIKTLLLSLITP